MRYAATFHDTVEDWIDVDEIENCKEEQHNDNMWEEVRRHETRNEWPRQLMQHVSCILFEIHIVC